MEQAIFKTLESFGFNQSEIKIYIFLAKAGPQKAKDVALKFEIATQRVYSYLKNLQSHKAVYTIQDRPTKYYALPFEQILEMYAKSRINEAQTAQLNKEKLLKQWQTMTKSKKTVTN